MKPHKRKAPAVFGNGRGSKSTIRAGLHSHSSPNLSMLLNRLEHVRPAGNSYRARCPVHQGNSRDSLKITPCDDGRILIFCFSQECAPLEILSVCGLEMTDIMPERLAHHFTPAERRKWREAATMRDWRKALSSIQHEAHIVWIAGKQIMDGKPLNDVDDGRLDEALERIVQAGRALNG